MYGKEELLPPPPKKNISTDTEDELLPPPPKKKGQPVLNTGGGQTSSPTQSTSLFGNFPKKSDTEPPKTVNDYLPSINSMKQPAIKDETRLPKPIVGETLDAELANRERYQKTKDDKPSKIIAEMKSNVPESLGGTMTKEKASLGTALAKGFSSVASSTLKSIGVAAKDLDFFNEYEGKKAEDLATYKAGQWIEDKVSDLVGDLSPEDQERFSIKLAQGAGQMAGFVLGGIGGKALKISPLLTTAGLGAAVSGASEYEAAMQSGASPDQASKAFWINAGLGTTEALPIMSAFRKMDKYTGGLATGVLAKKLSSTAGGRLTNEMAGGILYETAQETFVQALSNVAAANTYDATRKVYDGLLETAGISSIIGGAMTGASIAIRNKREAGGLTKEEDNQLAIAQKFAEEKAEESFNPDKKELTTTTPDNPKVKAITKAKTDIEADLASTDLPKETQDAMQMEVAALDEQLESAKTEAYQQELDVEKATIIKSEIAKNEALLADGNLSEGTKSLIQKQIDTDKEKLSQIKLPEPSYKINGQDVSEEVFLSNLESKKPLDYEYNGEDATIIQKLKDVGGKSETATTEVTEPLQQNESTTQEQGTETTIPESVETIGQGNAETTTPVLVKEETSTVSDVSSGVSDSNLSTKNSEIKPEKTIEVDRIVNRKPTEISKTKEKFKIVTPDGQKDVTGQKVSLSGYDSLDLFTHKEDGKDGDFVLTEKRTGLEIGRGKTADEANKKAIAVLEWQQAYNKEYPTIYNQVNNSIDKKGSLSNEGNYEDIPIPMLSKEQKIKILEDKISETKKEVEDKRKEHSKYGSIYSSDFENKFIDRIEKRIKEIKSEQPISKPQPTNEAKAKAKAPTVSDVSGDVKVQDSEYKGITGTTSVNVKEKDGIIKATFKGTRSDKPNATIGASGYRYGGKAVKETLSDFEKDYGVKVDEIIDGVDIAEITVLEERAEVNPREGVGTGQAVTLRITDTEGNIVNDVNIGVNKRKFTEQSKTQPTNEAKAKASTVSDVSGEVDKELQKKIKSSTNRLIDEKGEPITLYHVSDKLFENLKKSKDKDSRFGSGVYLSFKPEYKGEYTYVVNAYTEKDFSDGYIRSSDKKTGEVVIYDPKNVRIIDVLDKNGNSVKSQISTNEAKAIEVQQPTEVESTTIKETNKVGEGAEETITEKIAEPPVVKEFDKMATSIPNGGEVKKYLSGDTIKKYEEGTELRNNQEITAQELEPALKHGVETIDKAKEIFGDGYVEKTLDYIEREKLNPENKALLYVSLENDMAKRILAEPDNLGLKKLQDLVRTKSQAYLRSNSLAINMGRLRKFAEAGYDISKVTDKFFSSKELEQKAEVEKAVQADAETIQKESELKETEGGFSEDLENKIQQGVEKEINTIYENLPTNRKRSADKAIKALDNIQKKLRSKTYDASLGIPVAIIDAGITTIKNAIKAGVSITNAIELGIKKIKDKYGKDWDKESDFRKDMLNGFKESGIKDDKDINPKKYVKESLISQGFGKEITVTVNKKDASGNDILNKEGKPEKEKVKKQILDWKKLAGEEGSVDKISENVSKSLQKDVDSGKLSKEEVIEMKDDFIQEYNDLRSSVIEKGLNELASRNKTTVTPAQKSAAKKLAEMYNYGLFDKEPIEFEKALTKAIGVDKLNEGRFQQVKELGDALATLFSSDFKGKRLSEREMKSAIQVVEDKMRHILHQEAKQNGSTPLMLADMARTYMDAVQRMTLNNLKQALENPLSGQLENIYSSIGYTKDMPKELGVQRRKMAVKLYKEMVLQGGTAYGDVSSTFVNKGNLEMMLKNMPESQLLHGITSTLLGRSTLDAVDSFYKAKITNQKFTYNLIQILTKDRLVNGKIQKGMSKEDAKKYVAEKLTGQSFKDAQETAKTIIGKVNEGKKEKVLKDSPEFVDRLANDIVTASLVNGEKITEDMVTASYNAAYKAAGRGLGHVANNWISRQVGNVTGEIETRINDAIKEKDYRKAALLTMESIFFRNIANPFVGGGTNWVVLRMEKTGLGLVSGLGSMMRKGAKMDLTSETGIKNLEKAMYENMKIKDKFIRGAVGGLTTALIASLFYGIVSTDEYRKWRNKNMWAARYLDSFTPELVLATMAAKDDKMKRYLESTLNQNEQFDKTKKLMKATVAAVKGDRQAALGQSGEVLGGIIGLPFPWRLVRDGVQIAQGASGGEVYKVDNRPSKDILEGYLKGGLLDFIGVAPEQPESMSYSNEELKDPVIKFYSDKGVKLPQMLPNKIQIKKVNGKVTEYLSDMPKDVQDKYIELKRKYIKEELSKLKEGKIKIYVDKYGTATTPTTRDGMRDKKRVYINSLSVDQLNNVIYGSGGISAEVTEKVKDILFKEKK